jgi:hypothetical protein
MKTKRNLVGGASCTAIASQLEEPRPKTKKPDLAAQLAAGSKPFRGGATSPIAALDESRRSSPKDRPELDPVKPEPPPRPDATSDLIVGMSQISAYWRIPERQAYGLAQKGMLPGVFKLSPALWALCPSVAQEVLRERARGTCR